MGVVVKSGCGFACVLLVTALYKILFTGLNLGMEDFVLERVRLVGCSVQEQVSHLLHVQKRLTETESVFAHTTAKQCNTQ